MSEKSSTQSFGPSFCSLLTILCIGLKLTGYSDWSWLWVLAPLWLPLAVFLGVLLIIAMVGLIVMSFTAAFCWLYDKTHTKKDQT